MNYLSKIFSNPSSYKRLYDRVEHNITLLRDFYKFDTLVFTGVSGMSIGFPISLNLGLNKAVIRKTLNGCHATGNEYPNRKIKKYFILDDFIVTGSTIEKIIEEMEKSYTNTHCVGIGTYSSVDYCDNFFTFNSNRYLKRYNHLPLFDLEHKTRTIQQLKKYNK